jgi:hypothetical protein
MTRLSEKSGKLVNRIDFRSGECAMNLVSRQGVIFAMISASILLSACASQDTHFGDSVRHVNNAQIYDKTAALSPDIEPVPQDGKKAQIVIDTYWEVGRERKEINNAIDIDVGN